MPEHRARSCIGLVTPAFDQGGLEQVVLNLYRGYRAAGLDCVVLVEGNSTGRLSAFVEREEDVFIFNGSEQFFLRALLERRVGLLHYHYSTFGLQEVAALGLPTIYTLHNLYTWLDPENFRERARRIEAADHVVAVSAAVRNYFCARASASFGRVEVIENGVDLAELLDGGKVSRRDLSLPDDVFLFANVASFHRNKHQGVIIAAAERLMQRRRDFHVALIGDVGDRRYFAEIQDRLALSPAAEHITVCAPLARDRMGAFYRDVVDCVLLPSIQEGCSNVIQEAVALGRPVIATQTGHAAEMARRYDGVSIVPPAYSNLMRLNEETVRKLSRQAHPRNADALADAMEAEMDRPPRSTPGLVERHRQLGLGTMVDKYLERVRPHLLSHEKRVGALTVDVPSS